MQTIEFYRGHYDDNPLVFQVPEDSELLPQNTYQPIFQSADRIYKERINNPNSCLLTHTVLDHVLLKGIEEGILTLLHTPAPARFFLPLYVELILHYYNKRQIYFIDCENLFPAYEIIEAALVKQIPDDPHEPLKRVLVSRCFTYHQLTELVDQHLEPALLEDIEIKKVKNNPLIIISGISSLHFSKEATDYLNYDNKPPWYSVFELQHTLHNLKIMAMKFGLPVLLTAPSFSESSLKATGGTFLRHTSQVIVKLEETNNGMIWGTLLKHPTLAPRRTLIQIPLKYGTHRFVPLQISYGKNNFETLNTGKFEQDSTKTRFPHRKKKKRGKLVSIPKYRKKALTTYF